MNATMINNREYLDTLFAIESSTNIELVELVSNYYRIILSDLEKKDLLELPLPTKLFLVDFYKKPEATADDSFEVNIV